MYFCLTSSCVTLCNVVSNVVSLPGADVWGGDESHLITISEAIVGSNGYLIKKALEALFHPLRLFIGGQSDWYYENNSLQLVNYQDNSRC